MNLTFDKMNTISIVTICYNNLEQLKQTCLSVDKQVEKPLEHWIIDGSTESDIKNWLNQNTQPFYRKWINEQDKGISDAFNKGINYTTGEIITLLNSGDCLYNENVLEKVVEVFKADPNIMWCNGKLNLRRGGIWVLIGKPFEKAKLYRGMRGVLHPTMYIKKELYTQIGLFNIQLKFAMDYDLLCRIAEQKNIFIDAPLATFDPTGRSTTHYLKALKEASLVYQKYFGKSIKLIFWQWRLTFLHYLLNSRLGHWLYKIKVQLKLENR